MTTCHRAKSTGQSGYLLRGHHQGRGSDLPANLCRYLFKKGAPSPNQRHLRALTQDDLAGVLLGGVQKDNLQHTARAMESFFGTLKTECLHHYKFQTHDQAKQVGFDYIEVFYNRIRRHATIQNQAPSDYAEQFYKGELQIAA
jgi:Integrase core domain